MPDTVLSGNYNWSAQSNHRWVKVTGNEGDIASLAGFDEWARASGKATAPSLIGARQGERLDVRDVQY